MDRFLLIGTSHRIVPPTALGALPAREDVARELAACRRDGLIAGAVLLATCNRYELYIELGDPSSAAAVEARLGAMFDPLPRVVLQGFECALHLFRVTGSLDSMVLGENQILGQVKTAWHAAREDGLCSTLLEEAFREALGSAKAIRNATGLGQRPVSVASLAARYLADRLRARHRPVVVLLGAGEMIRKAAPALREAVDAELVFVNRSLDKAVDLAHRNGGRALPLDRFLAEGCAADAVVVAVRSDRPLCDAALLARLRCDDRVEFVDLSVPGQVALPAQGPRHRVFDMDRLREISEAHAEERRRAASRAEPLAEQHVARLAQRVAERGLDLREVRTAHLDLAEREAEARIRRSFAHLSEADREAIRGILLTMARSHAHLHLKHMREQLVGASRGEG
ncbi:MAG: hypothetical protein R3F30_14415 [Planctomycetota bacterium]